MASSRRVHDEIGSSRTLSRQVRSGRIVVAKAKGAKVVSAGRIGRLRTGSEFRRRRWQVRRLGSVGSERRADAKGGRLRGRGDRVHLVARCDGSGWVRMHRMELPLQALPRMPRGERRGPGRFHLFA